MKHKTVTEALGMLLIFNGPDYLPDYMASTGVPLHEITKKDLQVINIQAVRDICDLLGVPKELPVKSKLRLSKKRRGESENDGPNQSKQPKSSN